MMTCELLILFILLLELVIWNFKYGKGHVAFWENLQCCIAPYVTLSIDVVLFLPSFGWAEVSGTSSTHYYKLKIYNINGSTV